MRKFQSLSDEDLQKGIETAHKALLQGIGTTQISFEGFQVQLRSLSQVERILMELQHEKSIRENGKSCQRKRILTRADKGL